MLMGPSVLLKLLFPKMKGRSWQKKVHGGVRA